MVDNCDAELRKPIKEFATAEHMTMFSRPQWQAYKEIPHKLRILAQQKVLRAQKYDSRDAHHVFAAAAFRLCLDVCMGKAEAMPLAHRAVNSHLRIVLRMNSP